MRLLSRKQKEMVSKKSRHLYQRRCRWRSVEMKKKKRIPTSMLKWKHQKNYDEINWSIFSQEKKRKGMQERESVFKFFGPCSFFYLFNIHMKRKIENGNPNPEISWQPRVPSPNISTIRLDLLRKEIKSSTSTRAHIKWLIFFFTLISSLCSSFQNQNHSCCCCCYFFFIFCVYFIISDKWLWKI